MIFFLFVTPQYSGNPVKQEVETWKAPEGMEDTKGVIESRNSKLSRDKTHMNTQILLQHIQDMHTSGPDGVTVLKLEEVHINSPNVVKFSTVKMFKQQYRVPSMNERKHGCQLLGAFQDERYFLLLFAVMISSHSLHKNNRLKLIHYDLMHTF